MDFFTKLESLKRRIEREKNLEMKNFVTTRIQVIINIDYILREIYNKRIDFFCKKHYKLNFESLIVKLEEIVEVPTKVTQDLVLKESQCTSTGNKFEFDLVMTLAEKQMFIEWLTEFESYFNLLNKSQRKLLYYTLFEKMSNEWISLNLNYSERTIRDLKTKSINSFYHELKLGKITSQEMLSFDYITF